MAWPRPLGSVNTGPGSLRLMITEVVQLCWLCGYGVWAIVTKALPLPFNSPSKASVKETRMGQ